MNIVLRLPKITSRLLGICGRFRAGKHSRLSVWILVAACYAVPLVGCAPDHGQSPSTVEIERGSAVDRERASAMSRTAKVFSTTKITHTTKVSSPTPTVFCTANLITSSRPGSLTPIPLPERALLTPQPEPECEFQNQSPPTQTEPDTESMKLDRERNCYREAEIIARTRLHLLQASVGETIKAAILGRTAD